MKLYLVHSYRTVFPLDDKQTPELESFSRPVIADSQDEAIKKFKNYIASNYTEAKEREDMLDCIDSEGMYTLYDSFEANQKQVIL